MRANAAQVLGHDRLAFTEMIEGERAALRRYRLLDLGPAAGTAKCAHAVRLLKLVASNPTAVQLATAAVVVGWARG